jgi:protein-S-isoprenylcysteine O-methyltransferase Ste14
VSIASSGAGGAHSTFNLTVRSLLADLWFALVFFVGLPAAVLRAAGAPLRPPPGPSLAVAVGLIAVAFALVAFHVVAFVRQGRGTPAPLLPPRRLVSRGLYRWIRNPMYLLYTVVIAGEALAYRSWALLATAVGFWLLAHLYVVHVEEKQLQRRFGEAYDEYRRRTPRWLPLGPSSG